MAKAWFQPVVPMVGGRAFGGRAGWRESRLWEVTALAGNIGTSAPFSLFASDHREVSDTSAMHTGHDVLSGQSQVTMDRNL